MADQFGMTVEERNRQNFKEMAEKASQVQKERQERHESISNAVGRAISTDFNTAEMTVTAKSLLNGKITPNKFGVDKAIDFSNQCNTAIGSLEKKLITARTTAGFLSLHGKFDAYRNKVQEIETIEEQINLFKKFI